MGGWCVKINDITFRCLPQAERRAGRGGFKEMK